jgi:hypothetical protein
VSKKKIKATNRITPEDKLDLLRFALNHGRKRPSIPTDGILLGVLPRENSKETRYSWASINGHPYLRIQVFQYDVRDGSWRPVKGKCDTVRVHELGRVLGYIQEAIDLAAAQAMADLEGPFSTGVTNTSFTKEYEQMDFQ